MKTLKMFKARGILPFSLFILWATICKSQVSYFGAALLNSQKLETFKKTTTLFTLQYTDYAELEKFDQAIKKTGRLHLIKSLNPKSLLVMIHLLITLFLFRWIC